MKVNTKIKIDWKPSEIDLFLQELKRLEIPISDFSTLHDHCDANVVLSEFLCNVFGYQEHFLIENVEIMNAFSDKYNLYFEAVNQTREYKDLVYLAMDEFEAAYKKLNNFLGMDSSYGVDINNFICDDFPFPVAFEDVPIPEWVEHTQSNLKYHHTAFKLNPEYYEAAKKRFEESGNFKGSKAAIPPSDKMLVDQVWDIISNYVIASWEDVVGLSQKHRDVFPRHLFCFIMNEHFGFKADILARIVNRDRSTVVNSIFQGKQLVKHDVVMEGKYNAIKKQLKMYNFLTLQNID